MDSDIQPKSETAHSIAL